MGDVGRPLRVGMVGWRGMVGSVLLARMRAEGDFDRPSRGGPLAPIQPVFFSTSQAGQPVPRSLGELAGAQATLRDAGDAAAFEDLDVVLTCQGGAWTQAMYPALRARGWGGHWIDAASALRMADEAVIVLDPLNRDVMDRAYAAGTRTWVGGNCTVSLMLMGLGGLIRRGWVEWISTMTYQAASGAGARNMRELVAQMRAVGDASASLLDDPAASALDLDRAVAGALTAAGFPAERFGAPLAASVLPWIDSLRPDGATREEWKGHAEANKILALEPQIPIDGLCVRVGSMRSHAQALTIKLAGDIPLPDIEAAIAATTPWTEVVPNEPQATLARLTPAAVSGTLRVPVGRLRKLRMGPQYLAAFTVGDQLLWGAAEPLRRVLGILRERLAG